MTQFLKSAPQILQNKDKTLGSIFEGADSDKPGGLDATEINALLKQWGMSEVYSSSDVIKAADGNGNGSVDMNEIKAYAASLGVEFDEKTTLGGVLGKVAGLGGKLGDVLGGATNILGKLFGGNKSA